MGQEMTLVCNQCGSRAVKYSGYYAGTEFFKCETCGRIERKDELRESGEGKMKRPIDNLVPPPELCKRIPEGEFTDSVFMRLPTGYIVEREYVPAECVCDMKPAPTMQEIMLEIAKLGGWCPTAFCLHDIWTTVYQDDKYDVVEETDRDNPAAAALKLWMKLEGIEE